MKKNTAPTKNAVIYARYSSHSQRDVSIEQQVQKCREYAEREGLTVVGIYSDAAMSGKTDKRPQFQRMMKDSTKGGFSYVIAWKSNRMGRNMLEAMINDVRLMEEGVRCRYVEEDFGDTASGRFALRNMMNVNQFYSENMAEDIRRGLMDNASKCMVNVRPPLGYKKGEDGRFVIDNKTSPIVQEIFNRLLSGWSYADIAADLNRRGIKTAYGREWNKGSFHAMVKNEMYIGVYKYSSVRIEGGVPALLDKEVFEEVQYRLRTKKNPIGRSQNYSEYLLTGKLFCGYCKEPMVGASGTGRHGELHYYYVCQGRRKKKNGCKKKNVTREKIERQVIQAIRLYVLQDDVIDNLIAAYERFMDSARNNAELHAMEEELAQNQKAKANLMKAIEMGIITETTKSRLIELEDDIRSLERLIRIQKEISRNLSPEQVRFFIERFKDGDPDDPQWQRDLIRTFVQEIYLYDDYMKILFSFDPSGERRVSLEDVDGEEICPLSGSHEETSAPLFGSCTNPFTITIFAYGFVLTVPV